MARRPIDLSRLPSQFDNAKAGRTLIMDGDSACYVIAAKVKTLATAIRSFQMAVLTQIFVAQAENAEVHLTANDSLKCGRMDILGVKPYQGNRTGKAKPPLLEAVRQAVSDESNWLREYTVDYHKELEADDACMMSAYRLKDNGVMSSDDKDLRLTPYPWMDKKRGQVLAGAGFGNVWDEYTEAGSFKCMGLGRKFFWAQMLMGDAADNVQGLLRYNGKLCGPVLTLDVLRDIQGENDTANVVLDAYRRINQNPLPEGWLMWLLRWRGDNFWHYLQELKLSPANVDFINDCAQRNWFRKPIVEESDEY